MLKYLQCHASGNAIHYHRAMVTLSQLMITELQAVITWLHAIGYNFKKMKVLILQFLANSVHNDGQC
jgi:hypothetical protein